MVIRGATPGRGETESQADGAAAPVTGGGPRRALACIPLSTPVRDENGGARWVELSSVDLSLLNSGRAPILLGHSSHWESVVGVVEQAWLDRDCLMVAFRIGATDRCTEVWDLLCSGILVNVSAGALGSEVTDDAVADGVRFTNYRPFELSLVSIPRNWQAAVTVAPMPPDILDAVSERAASGAIGSAGSWRAWAQTTARELASCGITPTAEVLGAALGHAVEDELGRLAREARGRWLGLCRGA